MARKTHLLVGDEHGLLHLASTDSEQGWSAAEVAIPDVEVAALKGAPDGTAYVGTRGHGLFRSRNGLNQWEQVETPTGLEKVRSICISPDRLLVGTEAGERPAGVYEWDGGRRWQQLGDVMTCPGSSHWFYPVPTEGVHIRDLSTDVNKPERIYAAVQVGGVAISPDNGDTWYDRRNLDLDVHMVQPHPNRPGALFAGSGGEGVFRSRDSGETWERIGLECGNFVVEFAMDPRDPSRMYVGTGRGHVPDWRKDPAGARGEMYRSEDGGETWRKLAVGLPDQLQARPNTVFVDPEEPDNVYFGAGLVRNTGATDGGVFHSGDRGESWRKILDGGEPVAFWTRHD